MPGREMDMLLTTGERQTAALMTMALADRGIDAISFTGSQVGIITDTTHRKAKILEVKGDRVREALAAGKVAVVAGFQGVSTDKEITTMGRGASDLTASALAQALKADACEIYTDVTGVFTADPRIVPQARKPAQRALRRDARDGRRRLEGARPAFGRVRPHPRRSAPRSLLVHLGTGHVGRPMRSPRWKIRSSPVSSPTCREAKVTVFGVPDRPGISAALFEPLAAANVNVDMIVQNTSIAGTTDISFTMPMADMNEAEAIVSRVAAEVGATGVSHDNDIAKVSIVGAGMKSSPGIAAKMFRVLADEDVNIHMISTSTIRVSVVTAAGDMERAARALHTAFGLDSGTDYSAPLARTQVGRSGCGDCCVSGFGRCPEAAPSALPCTPHIRSRPTFEEMKRGSRDRFVRSQGA